MSVNEISGQKTIQQIIDENSKSTGSRNTGELGKDDFLNLLVTQLRYQDPLKPVDDKEFIGQMAQFTSLEQMQNMNSSISKSQAFSLIGKHVTANISDSETKEVKAVDGVVESVKMNAGKTYVVVNGEDVPLDKVVNVTDGSKINTASNLSEYTGLIGYTAKGMLYDPGTSQIVGVNGMIRAIQKGVYEDYAVFDGVVAEISDIITDKPSTDPGFFEDYLSKHLPPEDNKISVMVIDRATGQKVPVTARLRSYNKVDGNYSVLLDDVLVPVDGIANVTTAEQGDSQQADNSSQSSASLL